MIATATDAGVAEIVALEECFADNQRWSEASWRDELSGTRRFTPVVRTESGIIAVATFQLVDDVADLNRIIVSPRHRGQGHADRLVTQGFTWARRHGATRTLLEVADDNASAIALYHRHGFRRIAERRDYYSPGKHALIMEVIHV